MTKKKLIRAPLIRSTIKCYLSLAAINCSVTSTYFFLFVENEKLFFKNTISLRIKECPMSLWLSSCPRISGEKMQDKKSIEQKYRKKKIRIKISQKEEGSFL